MPDRAGKLLGQAIREEIPIGGGISAALSTEGNMIQDTCALLAIVSFVVAVVIFAMGING